MDDTALGALQRTLSDNREAKRKMLSRLAEIERESASLRAQLASLDAVIERTEQALL
jgi:Mg2+ and Co2+ transporter CorA